MVNFDSVIFDFDGTVADTGEGVFECVRYAVRMEGLPEPTSDELRKFIGPPLYDSFHYFYPEIDDERITQLIIHWRAKYSVDGIYKFKLYDGITELLNALHKAGIKTAIGSSKPGYFINHILDTCELRQYFDLAVGSNSDASSSDKEDIVRKAVAELKKIGCTNPIMIGDRKFDIVGARKVGVPCIAVLFGYGSKEEFEEYKADYIAADCDEIKKIMWS